VLADLFEANVDAFVADLRRRFPDATLVVTADHGMEGVGRLVRPNVALARAGLLATDAAGRIDLGRTRAVFQSNRGHMVFVNSARWHMGIVPEQEITAVKRTVTSILLGIRDPMNGAAPIRAVFDPEVDGEALGLGGPAGGDLYFDPAPGYYTQGGFSGDDVVIDTVKMGQGVHGAAPWRRNLQAMLFVVGPDVPRGARLGVFQGIDIAPTVAALVGAPPPRQSIGRAIVDVIR
jgi:predicted AlkP superfamily phosphohydrolase/phosphomutase